MSSAAPSITLADKLKHNLVFADGEAELAKLCRAFAEKKAQGAPLVHCRRYEILDNDRQSVRGEGYRHRICWVYLDRCRQWIDALPDTGLGRLVQDLKQCKRRLDTFPHYKTFSEKKGLLIDLDRERVRALAGLTAWAVLESAEYIAQQLDGAALR